ncbi:putative arabinose efflux permease, MFS family [Streptoalloteichus tenebrarius]|uniref:Arabinose efflux permease, MFS family n=1 Tax=Streptoalloteichus tenebrarius (strain ATCC 17920 / DSM 40477 / JCM 4838 / CBS 697.72 / NBRC 16177 / NCIMB 11028 / NRRL B-12390 / A12253. 1 / ISP 5477) TaxID=1933 RepID=A0ABT1HNG9_STRSD|nr:putative arabinose efflux permease, MFS family [Streptoalloteichus tenebrarius]
MRRALVDLTPLRISPAFRRLWIGRVVSSLGGQMTVVAVMFQVWRETGSTVWTGAVGLAQALPVIAFGLFAGALVDRSDRRRVYLVATAGQALCSVALAVQGFLGQVPVAVVLALVAAQSGFVAMGGPAFRSFIPHLLPRENVAAGLALNGIAFQAAMLVGPALGGLVLGWWGVGGCYLVDAVTFVVAFAGALGLPPMRPEGEPARPGLGGVLDGLAFLVRDPVVRAALLTDLALTTLSMPISLFPLVNAERFGDDPRTLGLFLTAIAVGGVLASLMSGTFTRLSRPGLAMLGGAVVWGAALALFGLSANPWAGLAFLAVAGAADTVTVVSRGTLVQLHTPNALLGRVGAAEQIVGRAGPDVGNMRGGLVADATSGTVALVSGGVMCVAVVVALGLTTPALRRSWRPGDQPTPVT